MSVIVAEPSLQDSLIDLGQATCDRLSHPWITVVDQLLQPQHDDSLNDRYSY